MPVKIGYQCAVNQIRAITFKSMPFKIDSICVSEHFNRASSHLQLLILRILQFFTAQFYRLLLALSHSVNLPQQAKRKCQKPALLLLGSPLITASIPALSRKTFKFLLYSYLSEKRRIYKFDTKQSQMEDVK